MYQKVKKLLAALCVFAMVITALPAIPAKAATAVPKFQKTYASIYENGTSKGKYNYTLKNLKKGQTVKWSVSGEGKSYVKVKKASKKATGSSMLNIITVKTNGKTAAKNKKVTLTAKVYSSAGKLQYTVKTSAKIKIKPTKVTLTAPLEAEDGLLVGKSYKFSYDLTPANATSTNVWTVTAEDGTDYSAYMSSLGVFTPEKEGIYTIKMSAMIGEKVIKSASKTVDVSDYMVSAKQTGAKTVQLNYSGDMRDKLDVDDFTITNASGGNVLAEKLTVSADGKALTLTTYSHFKNGSSYIISDGSTEQSFKASVGVPVKLEILTDKVTVDKATTIEYALYDMNGIDVTEVYEGTLTYIPQIMNGNLTDTNQLYMRTVGNTATITLKYVSNTYSTITLEDTAVIVCVAAQTSGDTNFTLTTSTGTPNYTASTYKDNRKVAVGSTYYAHFRALDTDKSEIAYSSIKYESSDPDTLIISASGKVTPIRNGSVKIRVTAVYAGEEYVYSYEVTIAEAAYLNTLKLNTSSVTMSNVYNVEYQKYIEVSALDQYGERFLLTDEDAVISETSTIKASIASYDKATNRIVLNASLANAGTYTYMLTLTSGSKKASAYFNVVVMAVPTSGTETYRVEADTSVTDLSLNADVDGSRFVDVHLSTYRNGVFTNYMSFTSATITKDGYYYDSDLTLGGSSSKKTLGASSKLSLKTVDITSNVCRKAETGTYTISLQYYTAQNNAYATLTTTLTITDTQDEPEMHLDRVKSSRSCTTALELVKDCMTPSRGTITECVVTGESTLGSTLEVKSGDQINIKSITVEDTYTIANGQTVKVTYTISVGKTLTNI